MTVLPGSRDRLRDKGRQPRLREVWQWPGELLLGRDRSYCDWVRQLSVPFLIWTFMLPQTWSRAKKQRTSVSLDPLHCSLIRPQPNLGWNMRNNSWSNISHCQPANTRSLPDSHTVWMGALHLASKVAVLVMKTEKERVRRLAVEEGALKD